MLEETPTLEQLQGELREAIARLSVIEQGIARSGQDSIGHPRQHGRDAHNIGGHNDAYNGTFMESFSFTVAESGGSIIGTIIKNPSTPDGDLTQRFSDGYSTLPASSTVTLTAGTATVPKKN